VRDKAFAHTIEEIHELFAHSLIILATIHAGAALIHHFILKDNTMRRMLPFITLK
jgi:cytochrome b561